MAEYGARVELDHVFCVVDPADDWAGRLSEAGLALDQGGRHPGQGTRNRRLSLSSLYLELLWVCDRSEARRNPLRLDRRGDWLRSGASPFGIGLRGRLPEQLRDDYWLHDGLGFPLWVHRDNENAPERPMVFVLELAARLPRRSSATLVEPRVAAVDMTGLSAAAIPPCGGPPVTQTSGAPRLDLLVDGGPEMAITDILALRSSRQPTAGRR